MVGGTQSAVVAVGRTGTNPVLVEDVHVSGTLTGTGGQLAGIMVSGLSGDIVRRVSFRGTITNSGGEFVGGIVRVLAAGGVVSDAVFVGTIATTQSKAGGIIETQQGSVERAVARVTITGPANRFGGIAAVTLAGASLTDVLAVGSFDGTERIAGLVAEAAGATTITRGVSAATITASVRDGDAVAAFGRDNVTATSVFYDAALGFTVAGATGGTPSTVGNAIGLATPDLQDADFAALSALAAPVWVLSTGAYPTLAIEADLPAID